MTVAALTSATVGTAYNQTAVATLVDADDGSYSKVWSMTASGGALGLTINAQTGAITGTPTAAGSYAVTMSVTDSLANNVSGQATLTVTAVMMASVETALTPPVMASHYQPVMATEAKAPKKAKKAK
ncbi:Ig domain-containing protein [Buttiauxella sp. A111]|uniref:Ig domain-containing protein n=1 Tax=Buttiauxella sp. A111 TaxID=2563088 RepID=UPI0010E0DC3B|nr:Ig domain-containing protein [Buttiauxella sp. A111]GDX06342.1 hypothetical protein BSPA111_25510 [Buttiauxella sp. A111]